MENSRNDILKYLLLIVRKRYLFVFLALCIMSVIVWGSYFIPKKYKAKSVVFIERNVIEELVRGIAITPSMSARIRVLRDTMLSRSVVLNVLRKLDLDTRAGSDKELEQMINSFQNNTNVDVRRNNLISVSFIHKNPVLARDYINKLVSEYVEKNIFAKREEAYDATKFLNKQVDYFKDKMDSEEKEIIEFRRKEGVFIALNEMDIIKEIKEYEKEIESIKIKINELAARKKSIQRELNGEKPMTITMLSRDESEGASTEALENRLKQLLVKYTENYPEVIRLKAQIEAQKNKEIHQPGTLFNSSPGSEISAANPVYQELKKQLANVKSDIEALNARREYLSSVITEKEEQLRYIPESKKQLRDMERERASYANVYEKLLQRLGQSEVSKQMEIEDKAATFRIIEPAILPTIPVSPNRKMIILAGIIIGLLGSFGVLFLLDMMDHSVKSVDELKAFGIPVLAIIPRMQSADDLMKTRRKDFMVFSFAGLYMMCILGALAMEFLGISYIDNFISRFL